MKRTSMFATPLRIHPCWFFLCLMPHPSPLAVWSPWHHTAVQNLLRIRTYDEMNDVTLQCNRSTSCLNSISTKYIFKCEGHPFQNSDIFAVGQWIYNLLMWEIPFLDFLLWSACRDECSSSSSGTVVMNAFSAWIFCRCLMQALTISSQVLLPLSNRSLISSSDNDVSSFSLAVRLSATAEYFRVANRSLFEDEINPCQIQPKAAGEARSVHTNTLSTAACVEETTVPILLRRITLL